MFLGIPALVDYTKWVQNVSRKGNLYHGERTSTHGFHHFGRRGSVHHCLPCPFFEPLCSHISRESPRRTFHEIWFLLFSYVFNPPPHFRNLSTNQSILVLSLLNIFTVFNTHTHIHARAHTRTHRANQNVYGFVKGDHVVTILFVLTFSEMNINFRFL